MIRTALVATLTLFALPAAAGEPTSAPTSKPVVAPSPPKVEPLPDGMIVPTVGKPIEAAKGGPRASFLFRAVFEVDPADPAIVAARAVKDRGAWDAGDLAADLYMQQVRAAGVKAAGGPGAGGYYPLPGGRVVVVRADDTPNDGQKNRFTIILGTAGG